MTYGIGPRRRRRADPADEPEAEDWLAGYRPSSEDSDDDFPAPRARRAAPVSPADRRLGRVRSVRLHLDLPVAAVASGSPRRRGNRPTRRRSLLRVAPDTAGRSPPAEPPTGSFPSGAGSAVTPRRPPGPAPHPDEEPIFRRMDLTPPSVPATAPQEEPILKYMEPRERTGARSTYGGRRRAPEQRAAITGTPPSAPVTPRRHSPPSTVGGGAGATATTTSPRRRPGSARTAAAAASDTPPSPPTAPIRAHRSRRATRLPAPSRPTPRPAPRAAGHAPEAPGYGPTSRRRPPATSRARLRAEPGYGPSPGTRPSPCARPSRTAGAPVRRPQYTAPVRRLRATPSAVRAVRRGAAASRGRALPARPRPTPTPRPTAQAGGVPARPRRVTARLAHTRRPGPYPAPVRTPALRTPRRTATSRAPGATRTPAGHRPPPYSAPQRELEPPVRPRRPDDSEGGPSGAGRRRHAHRPARHHRWPAPPDVHDERQHPAGTEFDHRRAPARGLEQHREHSPDRLEHQRQPAPHRPDHDRQPAPGAHRPGPPGAAARRPGGWWRWRRSASCCCSPYAA